MRVQRCIPIDRSRNETTTEELPDCSLWTALNQKCWESARKLLQLVDNERFLRRKDSYGSTVLHEACKHSAPQHITRSLLAAQSEACLVKDDGGDTPLSLACRNARDEIVLLLLEACPKAASIQCRLGMTPLHTAVRASGRMTPRVIQALVCANVDALLAQDFVTGQTPLHVACGAASAETIRLIFDACPRAASLQTKSGDTPLHLLIRHKRPSHVIQKILESDPFLVGADSIKSCPLCYFCRCYAASAQRFCENRQSINDDPTWVSEVCGLLLESSTRGTPFNRVNDEHPWNVLHASIKEDRCPWVFVRFFLKLNPRQATISDEHGNLSVHLACSSGKRYNETSFLLLISAYPASLSAKNQTGSTPLHIAVASGARGDEEMSAVRLLLSRYPKAAREMDIGGNSPLHLACASGRPWDNETFDLLFTACPDTLLSTNKAGLTPLQVAVMRGVHCPESHPTSAKAYPWVETTSQYNCDTVDKLCQINLIFRLLDKDPSLLSHSCT